MLHAVARPMNRLVERWLPGSLIFAVALTVIVAVMALTLTDIATADLVLGWGDGLADLLAFMTQIALVLLLGYTLANLRPVQRLLRGVAQLPRTPRAAYPFVALVAGLASLLSFGLGLIIGGVMAVQVARQFRDRGQQLHYPLLVAAGYSGFVVWHMGYSGSGPLNAATEGGIYTELGRDLVPVSETTFATWNLIAIVVTLVVVCAALWFLAPRGADEIRPAPDAALEEAVVPSVQSPSSDDPARTPADRLESLRAVTLLVGVLLGVYVVLHFEARGFELTLDIVNWTFLCLIFLLVGNARELAALIARGGRTVGEVLLQYPLYAGIAAMMSVSGLVEKLSDAVVGVATPGTLGLLALLAAGLLNIFIPSGGGQFAVQAPIFAGAADSLGVEQSVVIMAIAYGDQWTNMIQPFWAIPLLAVAGLKVRDILGYTSIVLVLTGLVFAGTMLAVGAG